MQGSSTSNFTFEAQLKNLTADNQLYALNANAPQGWFVTFSADYKQVPSVNIDANSTKNLSIQINAPPDTKAGTYKILIGAVTSSTSATLELNVVITGSYNMVLTTPTGLLSTRISEGDEKKLVLLLKNTGSADLKDVKLNATGPANWEVSFDPKRVDRLEPGASAQVFATIKVAKKTIVGDYITKFDATTPETNSKTEFRVTVEAPFLLGWIGILIILIAFGSVYYLFRKYGRR